MLTVSELYQNTAVSRLSIPMWNAYNVKNFEMEYFDDAILYKVPVESFTDQRVFNTNILVKPVQFLDLTEEEYRKKEYANVKMMREFGVPHYFIQHTMYSTVQISCDCENYIYTYAYSNAAVGSHYGPLPQFTVKGTGRPKNPQHIPGMCKHTMNAINGLYGCFATQLPTI